jgi:superkiller protein 3
MALVLLGAALQETEHRSQAPNAYRKATEANPGQPLAWQGLVSFYEKEDSDEGKTELLEAYQKLVPLERLLFKHMHRTNVILWTVP